MSDISPRPYLNSYDLFKLLALLTMTIDHVGAYLLPDELWLRAIGRCSAPIWLFLAGYGARLPVSRTLIAGAALIALLEYISLGGLKELNILVAIIIARLAIRSFSQHTWFTQEPFTLFAACAMAAPLTLYLWEYGTLTLLFAAAGYYAYHHSLNPARYSGYLALSWLIYLALQPLGFAFEGWHLAIMLACAAPVALWMWRFEADQWTYNIQHNAARIAHILSRQSLYYYVWHLALLIPLGLWLNGA